MQKIKMKVTFKSGRELSFDVEGHENFRTAAEKMLKSQWNIFNNGAFQTTEIESITEVKL